MADQVVNPKPAPTPGPVAPAPLKTKPYRVLLGKHFLGKNDQGIPQYAKQGDIVQLTPEQAERFKGKFGPATQPVKEEDGGEKVEAKGQAQAPAQA